METGGGGEKVVEEGHVSDDGSEALLQVFGSGKIHIGDVSSITMETRQ